MLPHKVGLHFRGVEGQGVKTCACRPSKIEKDYPDFWQKLQRTKLKLKTSIIMSRVVYSAKFIVLILDVNAEKKYSSRMSLAT